GYASVEMSWRDLAERIVSTFGVPYEPLQRGIVGEPYRDAFGKAVSAVSMWDFKIIDDAAMTAAELTRQQRVGRYGLLIVDYLQRMPFRDRQDLNAQIKGITTLARNERIPVLLLSQFSRPWN